MKLNQSRIFLKVDRPRIELGTIACKAIVLAIYTTSPNFPTLRLLVSIIFPVFCLQPCRSYSLKTSVLTSEALNLGTFNPNRKSFGRHFLPLSIVKWVLDKRLLSISYSLSEMWDSNPRPSAWKADALSNWANLAYNKGKFRVFRGFCLVICLRSSYSKPFFTILTPLLNTASLLSFLYSERDSNPHGHSCPLDFKSSACYQFRHPSKFTCPQVEWIPNLALNVFRVYK